MATTDSPSPRKPVTAAQQRAQRETTQPVVEAAPTTDQLVEGIERTREDLASTLDEIADKVSPKRVAKRTSQKVAASVKETAASAKESVVESASSAKEAAADTVTAAKKRVGKTKAPAEPVVVLEAGPLATPTVGDTPPALAEALAEEPAPVTGIVPPADLPPVAAVEVPTLGTSWSGPSPMAGTLSSGGASRSSLPVPAPVLAGAGVLGLLLVVRWWRRRR